MSVELVRVGSGVSSGVQGRPELAFGEASRLKNKQQQRDNIIKLDAHGSQQKLSVEAEQSATVPS